MSNVKRILIQAVVPFDFVSKASDHEAAMLARLCMNPSMGLRYHVDGPIGGVPNKRGGVTTMYRVRVEGTEAISYTAFDRIVATFKSQGEVETAEIEDLEAYA